MQQPHASLLVTATERDDVPHKWCENRSWKPHKDLLKPSTLKADAGLPRLLIHASSKFDAEFPAAETPDGIDFPRSAIIGSVRLLGVVYAHRRLAAEVNVYGLDWLHDTALLRFTELRKQAGASGTRYKALKQGLPHVGCPIHGNTGPELYWWLFDRPIRLSKPISSLGKLNIWSYGG